MNCTVPAEAINALMFAIPGIFIIREYAGKNQNADRPPEFLLATSLLKSVFVPHLINYTVLFPRFQVTGNGLADLLIQVLKEPYVLLPYLVLLLPAAQLPANDIALLQLPISA